MKEYTGSKLRVWVLSDGQPGHYNLSRGIVAALRRLQAVQESWITTRLRVGLGRNLLRAYLNRVHRAASPDWLKLFYDMDQLPDGDCDLIVSAGGKTSFANAWLAQWMGVPNLYAGSLRRLSPQLFSVVMTLEPIGGATSNLVLDLPPSAVDFDKLQIQGEHLLAQLGLADQRCWTLMIGGDGAGYRYQRRDWRALARVVNELASCYGIHWLLVGSRRTGKWAEHIIDQDLNDDVLAARCWYDGGSDFSAEPYLGAAECVFVTEDSMTMLTEAIYSRRPVFSLRPEQVAATGRYTRMLEGFVERGYLCRYPMAELASHPQSLAGGRCRVLQTSPLDDLAERLGRRLALLEPAESQA